MTESKLLCFLYVLQYTSFTTLLVIYKVMVVQSPKLNVIELKIRVMAKGPCNLKNCEYIFIDYCKEYNSFLSHHFFLTFFLRRFC